jgi:hypothetical protein
MAFDSLHLSPSNCGIKVMKSNQLDSKSKGRSMCMVCVTIEKEKYHRLLADVVIFFYFFFTLSLLNDPISWCRSRSALITMAFDSLHLSPSNCGIKVMKSKQLDSKSKGQSTCNDECQRSHRLLADLIKYFSHVAFAGLFIFSYQFPFLACSFSCLFFFLLHFFFFSWHLILLYFDTPLRHESTLLTFFDSFSPTYSYSVERVMEYVLFHG